MSALSFLLAWGNVPFAVAIGLVAVFSLLQLTGILGILAGGGEGGEDEGDVEHDVDAEHDADGGEHDGGDDGDQDQDHDGAERSWTTVVLAPLGFGKIPFSMIWQLFALLFAVTGFSLNAPFFSVGPPLYTLMWTVPSAMLAGYVGVAILARALGPVLSSTEHEATSRGELVGQLGVVISSRVDEEFGEVRIRDKTGHDLRVVCKLAPGTKRGTKEIPREHQNVVVVDYDEGKGELFVEPVDLDGTESGLEEEESSEAMSRKRV